MTIKKDDAINSILEDFETFANLILQQLDFLEKIISPDEDIDINGLIDNILSNEKKLDKLEIKISDKIVNTIVLYQPVAFEIRKIIACYRIVISLERIGDQVVNVVHIIQKINASEVYLKLNDVVSNMLIQSSNMVNKSLLAFTKDDREFAIWTIKNDAAVDEINHKMLKKAIKKSSISKENKAALTDVIGFNSMVSNIERIADHATNIAEAAIYSIEGKDVRHSNKLE